MTVLRGLGEEIAFARAENGMAVFVMAKPGYRKKFAQVTVAYGANDVAFSLPDPEFSGHSVGHIRRFETPPGIAHFLEHKMFDRPRGSAFEDFSALGASANAFTSNDLTSYTFWTVDEFQRCLDLLLDLVWKPHFSEESVRKEQGIIEQEIVMYEDEPYSRLTRALLESLYHVHPVRIDVTGTKESIRKITPELLYTCHAAFYQPSNMVLFTAGDFKAKDEALRLAERLDSTAPGKGSQPVKERPEEPSEPRQPSATVKMHVSRPFVSIGWKDQPGGHDGKKLLRREIATDLLLNILFGKSSPVFARLYEGGLADDLGVSYEAWPDYAFATVTAETVEPKKLLDEVLKEVDTARRRGIPTSDFERAKDAAWGRYVTLFDDLDLIAESQCQLYFIGEDVFSYGEALKDITLQEVEERLSVLEPRFMAHVFLIPDTSALNSYTSSYTREEQRRGR
ncbi:MAG TPA: insulinase family protein [Firmicutes bacterium]|nr:insulinase family protein [Candidatus Fermentithermobacillaceae bacterium]